MTIHIHSKRKVIKNLLQRVRRAPSPALHHRYLPSLDHASIWLVVITSNASTLFLCNILGGYLIMKTETYTTNHESYTKNQILLRRCRFYWLVAVDTALEDASVLGRYVSSGTVKP